MGDVWGTLFFTITNCKLDIFIDDEDRLMFLERLGKNILRCFVYT